MRGCHRRIVFVVGCSGNRKTDKVNDKDLRRSEPGGSSGFGRRVVLLAGILLNTLLCSGQNVATNPGFETGDTSGWFPFGSPTISAQTAQVHSGTYAALVQNRTATYMGIAQSLQGVLQAGQPYNISAWVRLGSGAAQTVQMTIKKT